jgi:hypothetical protein
MIPKHQQINVWMNMSEIPEKKKARLRYDWQIYICKMLISIFSWFFHTTFKDLTEQILSKMQQNAPFCILLKKIPFFQGFIILYLKFWLHRFYIQNAAECTILCPSENKNSDPPTPLPLLVSWGLACMLLFDSHKLGSKDMFPPFHYNTI